MQEYSPNKLKSHQNCSLGFLLPVINICVVQFVIVGIVYIGCTLHTLLMGRVGLLTAKGYMLMLWVGYLLAMDEIVYG